MTGVGGERGGDEGRPGRGRTPASGAARSGSSLSCRFFWLARLGRALHRWTARTPAARLVGSPLVARLRNRLFEMRAPEVLRVLDALEAVAVQARLAGGWGVDALLGRQTRRHRDLDVVIDSDGQRPRDALAALHGLGYTPVADRSPAGSWMPAKIVLRHPSGWTVDLLLARPAADGLPAADVETGFGYGPDSFTLGVVSGRQVRCLSPSVQAAFHDGYEPLDHDRQDVALLCQHFQLPPPDRYR